MEIYSKSRAYIRSFRAGIGSQVGVVPFEASLHAPGLGSYGGISNYSLPSKQGQI